MSHMTNCFVINKTNEMQVQLTKYCLSWLFSFVSDLWNNNSSWKIENAVPAENAVSAVGQSEVESMF